MSSGGTHYDLAEAALHNAAQHEVCSEQWEAFMKEAAVHAQLAEVAAIILPIDFASYSEEALPAIIHDMFASWSPT